MCGDDGHDTWAGGKDQKFKGLLSEWLSISADMSWPGNDSGEGGDDFVDKGVRECPEGGKTKGIGKIETSGTCVVRKC